MIADTPHIDYESLAQTAMRGLVRSVLEQTAKTGLPGDHHFYISFDTCADKVSLSKRLKDKYPTEMTIVLQHRFWDLLVTDEGFEVKLTFDGIPERLVVPFSAIKVFFDPSVRYGLQFEDPTSVSLDPITGPDNASDTDVLQPSPTVFPDPETAGRASTRQSKENGRDAGGVPAAAQLQEVASESSADGQRSDLRRRGKRDGSKLSDKEEPSVLDAEEIASATEGAKILRLDAFRKKTP